jgi:hypothetical protein
MTPTQPQQPAAVIPLWDWLPCHSYLLSLLPVEDALKYVPGKWSSQNEFHAAIRCAAVAWLLWKQRASPRLKGGNTIIQSRHDVVTHTHIHMRRNRQHVTMFLLVAMDAAPSMYRLLVQQIESVRQRPAIPASASTTRTSLVQVAHQRRQTIRKVLDSTWPLIRLALWMQLAYFDEDGNGKHTLNSRETTTTSSIAAAPPLLFVLYAYRRWLQEQGMELWPTVLRPLLESSRETRRWVAQLWR